MPPENGVPKPHTSSVGPIIGAAIIIAVLAIGALYYWQTEMEGVYQNDDSLPMNENGTLDEALEGEEDASLLDIQIQSSSDELSSIETDLDATTIDDLDAELNAEASQL